MEESKLTRKNSTTNPNPNFEMSANIDQDLNKFINIIVAKKEGGDKLGT
jgi:hypothetical protein